MLPDNVHEHVHRMGWNKMWGDFVRMNVDQGTLTEGRAVTFMQQMIDRFGLRWYVQHYWAGK